MLHRRTIDERLWPSLINYVLHQARDNALAARLSHSKKIEKLADRQERPQEKLHRKTVKVLDDIKKPGWVDEYCLWTLDPVRYKVQINGKH